MIFVAFDVHQIPSSVLENSSAKRFATLRIKYSSSLIVGAIFSTTWDLSIKIWESQLIQLWKDILYRGEILTSEQAFESLSRR